MTESINPIGDSTPTRPLLPEAFDQFVGDTFFRQMLKSLRSTTGKPAFMHGGQAEVMFQSQMDEILITDMAKATRDSFSGELFKQQFMNHDPEKTQPQSDQLPATSPPVEIPLHPIDRAPTDSTFDTNI
jgi:Rod binding domain-containing protein